MHEALRELSAHKGISITSHRVESKVPRVAKGWRQGGGGGSRPLDGTKNGGSGWGREQRPISAGEGGGLRRSGMGQGGGVEGGILWSEEGEGV